MPLPPQSLNHHIRNRLLAFPAFTAIPIGMATHTPRIIVLLNKRRRAIERISTLRTEEMTGVPLRAASNDHLALNGRLARFAAWREQLVEVEMAVKSAGRIAVCGFLSHVLGFGHGFRDRDVETSLACMDAFQPFRRASCRVPGRRRLIRDWCDTRGRTKQEG